MSSFYVENFGCRATQADGAAIERQFMDQGVQRANAPAQAQWVIFNTCAVTAAAEQDARAAIRRIRRNNPDCQIIVTGCYAQRAPEEVAALAGVSHVIGNSHKHNLAQIALHRNSEKNSVGQGAFIPVSELLSPPREDASLPALRARAKLGAHALLKDVNEGTNSDRAAQRRNLNTPARECRDSDVFDGVRVSGRHEGPSTFAEIFVSDIFAHTELLAAPVFDSANERTRPNLKIQDGCNNRCSFCIIPSVRGRSRSLPVEDVLREVDQLVSAGYREVVLSGINLGRWGRDSDVERRAPSPVQSLAHYESVPHVSRGLRDVGMFPSSQIKFDNLIRLILAHTSVEKLRISSVEPMDWSDSLIRLVAESPRIAKHAHVPMQSGSDAVLRRMHRKYRPWHYREKIEKIRAAMPTAAIGADVMVGFPGETDSEFEETRRMIEDLPFTYLHVFTFSARPGTPAASMANQVPVHLARERNRVLRELAAEKKLAFMRSFIGQELAAITLNVTTEDADGPWTEALTDNYLKMRLRGKHGANRWVNTRVTAVEDGALIAIGDNSSEIANLGLNSMVLERTDAGRFESVDGQSGSSDIRGFNEHSSVGAAELSPAL